MKEGLYIARVVSPNEVKKLVFPAFTMHGYRDQKEARSAFLERLHHECVKDHGFRPKTYEYEPLTDEALAAAGEWMGFKSRMEYKMI